MALPVTITGLLVATTNVETFTQPFISSAGNVYVFGKGTTTTLLRAFKATDPTSSFANAGSDITLANVIRGVSAVQQNDVIHVMTIDSVGSTGADLRYHAFDMSSDSWTTSNELVVDDYSLVATATAAHVAVNIRSDGDVICLYNGPMVNISAANRETVYYARREAGTWTAGIEVSNAGATSWFAGGIVRGADDRMHFFFIDDGASDAYQRTLTSSNSLQTFPSSYDTSINTTQISTLAIGTSYDSGGTIKVRYPQEDATGLIMLSVKMDSADTPTVTTDADITGATDIESGSHRGSFSANGTTLWHTFVGSADSDIYTQSNVNDGGWSAPASFAVENSNGVRTNVYIRSGNYKLAMCYNSNSNTLYNEMDLGSAGSDIDIDATASVTWGGSSVATSALSSTALASVTWTGSSVSAGATEADWSSIARIVVSWNGASIASNVWSSTASGAASGGAVGASIDAQSYFSIARFGFPPSMNRWNGASIASGDYTDATISSITWGQASDVIAEAGFEMATTTSLGMVGQDSTPAAAANLDGWKPKHHQDDIEEEDLMFLMTAIHAYMEQNNVYH